MTTRRRDHNSIVAYACNYAASAAAAAVAAEAAVPYYLAIRTYRGPTSPVALTHRGGWALARGPGPS